MTAFQRFAAAALALSLLGLAAPAGAQGTDKVLLRFAPAQGSRLTYMLTSVINVDGKSFAGKDLALNADSRGEIGLTAKTSSRDSVWADITTPGLDVNIRLPERVLAQRIGTIDGRPLEVVFNRTGKVEAIRNPEVLGGANPFNVSIPQVLRDYFPAFPVQAVGRGDAWTETRRLTIPFQGIDIIVELVIDYTLDDILPDPDGRKALISAVYRVSVSGSQDLGDARGVFEGQGQGAGSLHVLVEKGWFSEYRLDFKTDAAFVMKRGEERLLEFPFSFSAFAEIVLISSQAPAPL